MTRSAAARLGRALGMGTGFVATGVLGWWLLLTRTVALVFAPVLFLVRAFEAYVDLLDRSVAALESLPGRLAPRRQVHRWVHGTGNTLVVFGAALLVFGGAVRVGRHVQLVAAQEDAPPPAFSTVLEAPAEEPAAQASQEPSGPAIPDRIVVPALGLDDDVRQVGWTRVFNGDDAVNVWDTSNYAAGFHTTSALMGAPGNTVISGHNNILGSVFRDLYKLKPGNKIYLFAGQQYRSYEVRESFIVKEAGVDLETRRANAQWIATTEDERLTLVSCYPPWGNSHRAIVVAAPLENDPGPPTTHDSDMR